MNLNISAEAIISEMDVLFAKIEDRRISSNKQMLKQIINKNYNLKDLSITECHVISSIGNEEHVNGIRIADKMGMTRGAISKVVANLIKKGLIISYQDGVNKKKIFYKLTPLGETINKIHNEEHEKRNITLVNEINKYTEKEQEIILNFIKNLQDFLN